MYVYFICVYFIYLQYFIHLCIKHIYVCTLYMCVLYIFIGILHIYPQRVTRIPLKQGFSILTAHLNHRESFLKNTISQCPTLRFQFNRSGLGPGCQYDPNRQPTYWAHKHSPKASSAEKRACTSEVAKSEFDPISLPTGFAIFGKLFNFSGSQFVICTIRIIHTPWSYPER